MFGLGNANVGSDDTDIEFGLHLLDGGTLEIVEKGVSKGSVGSYAVGDVLKVTVSGVVKYYRNGTLLYTSLAVVKYPLYLDSSIKTPGGKLVDALLCAGTKCLAAPQYTVYYVFAGKMVGMRRANSGVTGADGQFRMVGDHLGSPTLILDTASPPNVVQRQYSKPYGRERLAV